MAQSERQELYPTNRMGIPGTLLVDSELFDLAPIKSLPVVVMASLEITPEMGPTRTGILEQDLEDRIKGLEGRPAGHTRTATELLTFAYLAAYPSPTDLKALRTGWTDLNVLDDPDWSFFTEFLVPSLEEQQANQNLQVWVGLASQGDDLNRPRIVDHNLSFAAEPHAHQCLTDLRAKGFSASESRAGPDGIEVSVSRSETIDLGPGGLHDTVWLVRSTTEAHGGTYDGWGAPIVGGQLGRWWRKRRFARTIQRHAP
ncbi:MAG: hypothetical protein GY701_32135 [Sulfitobacter sp.]|nr:hypothetical protein [Sulfitobacter sp.]